MSCFYYRNPKRTDSTTTTSSSNKELQAHHKLFFLDNITQQASDRGVSHEAQVLFSSCTVEAEINFLYTENLRCNKNI